MHKPAIYCLTLAGLLAAPALAREVSLHVSVARKQLYLGESAIMAVKVAGSSGEDIPDISEIRNCVVKYLGSQNRSNYSITIVNGRVSKTGFSGREFTFELTPTSTGSIRAGPVSLRHGGKTLRAIGPTIEVVGVEEQDRVVIEVMPSKTSVLVDEPFEVTLSVSLRQLGGRYASTEPMSPQQPPKLTVPHLAEDPGPGLEGPDTRSVLQKLLVSRSNRPGFAVNNFTVRRDPFNSMFSFGDFMNEQPAKFRFERRAKTVAGEPYFEYLLTLKYMPRQESTHTFGPVVFKGDVVMSVNEGGHGVTRSIFAVGPACTVRVVPPPEEGRPDTFIGAIGTNLILEAALDTQTCKVGDPLSLTLAISGDVSLRNLRPPLLNAQEQLTRDFRIYDDTVEAVPGDDRKEYVYTIRPIHAGTLELPPIEVSYYDVRDRAYRTERTRPIPLRANPAVEFDDGAIISAGTNRMTLRLASLEEEDLVVAPVDMAPEGALAAPLVVTPLHLAVASAGPAAYILLLTAKLCAGLAARAAETRGRRTALRNALAMVRSAEAAADRDPPAALTFLSAALKQYVGNRLDEHSVGIAPSDAVRMLTHAGIDPDLVADFDRLFTLVFNAGYDGGPGPGGNMKTLCRDTREMLRRLEDSLRALSAGVQE